MGVRSVSGQELMAQRTLSTTLTPRPKGDVAHSMRANFEAKPEKAPEKVRARSEVGEEQSSNTTTLAAPQSAPEAAGVTMRFDSLTKRVVSQIVNEVNEVIKQIPPEETLRVVAKIHQLQGLLFDQEA